MFNVAFGKKIHEEYQARAAARALRSKTKQGESGLGFATGDLENLYKFPSS